MPGEWIDISVPLRSGMVHWPDNPPVKIERIRDMARGDRCNVSALSMGSHTGTHMDAPLHFIASGQSLDQMPPEAAIGPAQVIEIRDAESIKPAELSRRKLEPGGRVLFKTANSARSWKTPAFDENFIYISKEAAAYLVRQKIRVVGVDYLSVGFRKDGLETHQILLAAGVWIIEGLNLERVRPGRYELLCLPLKIEGSDGAPARALLRKSVRVGSGPPLKRTRRAGSQSNRY